LERILAPCRFTKIVSAAPLTWDPSLFWPETAKGMLTSTRELLRARSPSRCIISQSEVACWASGDYRTSGQIDVYYLKPSGGRAKNPGAMAKGNLNSYYRVAPALYLNAARNKNDNVRSAWPGRRASVRLRSA